MKLKPVKDLSLKEKIKNALIELIHSIDTGANDKLPREEILAKELQVSRNTMRGVLTELEQEGYIIRRHGKGTFINSATLQLNVPFTPSLEFTQMIKSSGYTPRLELLEIETIPAKQKSADLLHISRGQPLICVKKLFYANEHPAIYCIDRFPGDLLKKPIEKKDLQQNIYQFLRQQADIIIARDKAEIYTVTNLEVTDLQTYFQPTTPKSFLVLESVEFNEDNAPTLYNHVYYNTDYIRFNQVRPKKVIY